MNTPCWHCTAFDGLTGGNAALCRRPGASRLRASPDMGCASFEREVGVDDEPDAVPIGWRPAPVWRPWGVSERPPAPVPLAWAP